MVTAAVQVRVTVETAFPPISARHRSFLKNLHKGNWQWKNSETEEPFYFKAFEDLLVHGACLNLPQGDFQGKKAEASVQTSLDSYFKKPWPVWLRQKNSPKGRFHGQAFILSTWLYICDKSL